MQCVNISEPQSFELEEIIKQTRTNMSSFSYGEIR